MAKIKRFPNPGSNIDMLIYIFKSIYNNLSSQQYFSLYDMGLAMINNRLVSSDGYIGIKAFKSSLRNDSSRDKIYNQAKMYAEVYRALGWISSGEDANLIFSITEFGRYIATSDVADCVLYKESIMGIADPNEILEKKDGLQMRPFKHILNATEMLDNKICKLEMIIGPMHYSDTSDEEIDMMKTEIKEIRGSFKRLKDKVADISLNEKIAQNTMENYTRLPIATLDYLGWIDKERCRKIYPGQTMVMLNFTEQGKRDLKYYNSLKDIRIDEFNELTESEKKALVRISFYQQLKRCKIVNEYLFGNIDSDYAILSNKYTYGTEFLFSPYQMLPMKFVDDILGVSHDYSSDSKPLTKEYLLKIINQENENSDWLTEIYLKETDESIESIKELEIYKEIEYFSKEGKKISEIIYLLMNKYENANKDVFYPLIGDLFNILGLNCKVSRNGTNYERYDAIIIGENSIPIEIKSPGEEKHISVKAVRQALENKIILLSRKNYSTNWDTTSLVVGYNLPNDRAEVFSLIDDIKNVYNINIGVLDFKVLLEIVTNRVLYKKDMLIEDIEYLKGTISVNYEEN